MTVRSDSSPELSQFRVTLFFGPEPGAGDQPDLHCVFNVKKRSWKGGVQVTVEIGEDQLTRIRRSITFDYWLKRELEKAPEGVREEYASRARDLLVQAACATKLELALQAGLRQENQRIGSHAWIDEVDRILRDQPQRITTYLLTELDLFDP